LDLYLTSWDIFWFKTCRVFWTILS
jgi:hypothetical protein